MTTRKRKPTVVELDAKLLRDFIVESVRHLGSEIDVRAELLAALDRLERRATGSRVSSENYVLHIDRDEHTNSTWCGRVREAVNCVTEPEASKNIYSGEHCLSCVKAYLRVQKTPTP